MKFNTIHACLLLTLIAALAACSIGSSGSSQETYSVSATIADLKGTIALTLNNTYTVSATDSQVTFPQSLALAESYEISIDEQPAEQTCVITETTTMVEIKDGDVINVEIECSYSTITRITTTYYDLQGDFQYPWVQTDVYNHQGHLLLSYVEVELIPTPVLNLVHSYIYDAEGKLIHASDGTRVTVDYEYDTEGRLTASRQLTDGKSTLIRLYEYDEAGKLVSDSSETSYGRAWHSLYTYNDFGQLFSYAYDRDSDEIIDNRTFYYYDDAGNKIRQDYDGDGDGILDSYTTNTYDHLGNITEISLDDRLYRKFSYKFDSRGNMLSVTHYSYPSELEGTNQYPLKTSTYHTYDEHDNETSYAYDADGDDISDISETYTLEYNNAGLFSQIEVDEENDGQPERRQTIRYEGDLRIRPANDSLQQDYLVPFSLSWIKPNGHCCQVAKAPIAGGIAN